LNELLGICLIAHAVAPNCLPQTFGTPLDIAVDNVQLTFNDRTIAARAFVCAPVHGLTAVGDARIEHAADGLSLDVLSGLDLLGPACDHFGAVVVDEFVIHARPTV
jgi:hypothetical protein